MNRSDFIIGETFWCADRCWRCTDIGTRVIVAIRIDSVQVGSHNPDLRQTLSRSEAEAEGWFNGPPYAVAENVFDENDMEGCSFEAEAEAVQGAASHDPVEARHAAADILQTGGGIKLGNIRLHELIDRGR